MNNATKWMIGGATALAATGAVGLVSRRSAGIGDPVTEVEERRVA